MLLFWLIVIIIGVIFYFSITSDDDDKSSKPVRSSTTMTSAVEYITDRVGRDLFIKYLTSERTFDVQKAELHGSTYTVSGEYIQITKDGQEVRGRFSGSATWQYDSWRDVTIFLPDL